MSDRLYLDAIATTRLSEHVRQRMLPFWADACGLPSGAHTLALEARDAVDAARQDCLQFVDAPDRSVCVFTGSGTEANNLAVLGYAGRQGTNVRLVTSTIEHPSISGACDALERRGHEVIRLEVNRQGQLDPADAAKMLQKGDLVVTHLANYDMGARQDVARLGELAHQAGAVLVVDATHGAGWNPLSMQDMGVDIVTLSPHRFFGPAGVGVLITRPGIGLDPLYFGGSQESGLRPGSGSVALMVGAGAACAAATSHQEAWMQGTSKRQGELLVALSNKLSEYQLNGPACGPDRDPHHISLSVRGVEGEAVLLNLDLKGVQVTSNTGCVTEADKVSPVLRSMGVGMDMAMGTLVLGVLPEHSIEDMNRAVDLLVAAVERVRSMSQAWHQFKA